MKLIIPGSVYHAAIEESQVPEEEHWPKPQVRRVGKGQQYIYTVTPEQRRLILSHLEEKREAFAYLPADDREDYYTLRRWLLKL